MICQHDLRALTCKLKGPDATQKPSIWLADDHKWTGNYILCIQVLFYSNQWNQYNYFMSNNNRSALQVEHILASELTSE